MPTQICTRTNPETGEIVTWEEEFEADSEPVESPQPEPDVAAGAQVVVDTEALGQALVEVEAADDVDTLRAAVLSLLGAFKPLG